MNDHLVLRIDGEFWEVPVTLEVAKDSSGLMRGTIIVHSSLNLTNLVKELLGGEKKKAKKDEQLKLNNQYQIDFFSFKEEEQKYYAIKTEVGALIFQLAVAEDKAGTKSYSFFVKADIEKLLSAIPNIDLSDISGHVLLGIGKGKEITYQFRKNKVGVYEKEEVKPGFHLAGELLYRKKEINLQPPSLGGLSAENLPSFGASEAPANMDDLNQKLGPIVLKGFSFKTKGGKLIVLIRADFNLGGFGLHLLGLAVHIDVLKLMKKPKDAFDFKLLGLGLSYENAAFGIAGFFMKTDADYEEYVGGLSVKTKKLAITGVGMYANKDGYKSIFGYIGINANIGGDPGFYVIGLALCFGYNRQIISAGLDKLSNYPLIRYARIKDAGPKGKGRGMAAALMSSDLPAYIPPKKGSFFFGFGVRFTTYKLVDTVALLILAMSEEDVEFTLLGVSRLELPPGGMFGKPMIFIEIALKATYSVKKGQLQIEGRLTKESYVFSDQVKISGGFAFYAWFKDDPKTGAKAGEFVITAGGYHPRFKPPSYYPKVPPIAYEWKVGNSLNISGSMYMALTPIAIMAGGSFNAVWDAGGLFAQFSFKSDFIIQWKPFYYEAKLLVTMRAGVEVKIWGIRENVSFKVDTHLHIWGPDFSGVAKISVRIFRIGFDWKIKFGDAYSKPKALSWKEFKTSFLPDELKRLEERKVGKSNILSLNLSNGLVEEIEKNEQEKVWMVNPKEFAFQLSSIVPITQLSSSQGVRLGRPLQQESFYIPLYKGGTVKSELHLNIIALDGDKREYFNAGFLRKNVARALWNDRKSTQKKDEVVSSDATIKMVTGVELKLKRSSKKECNAKAAIKEFNTPAEARAVEALEMDFQASNYDDFFIFGDGYEQESFEKIGTEDESVYF